jgi:hypothetical protein
MSPRAASHSELASDRFYSAVHHMAIFQPILETMVNKANDIYNRWENGQEIQTVLQHVVSDNAEVCASAVSSSARGFIAPSHLETQHKQEISDPFAYTHQGLAQCIVEVHQRAKALYPQRKPCRCSERVSPPCPPSHFWAPPPNIPKTSPVLPDLYSVVFQRGGIPLTTPSPQPQSPLSLASRLAVVDTLNFELGALNSNTDQSWMSFF